MSDAYVVGDPDGLSPLQVELRDTIARELHAQLALRGERIELADLPEVSYQVTIQVERAIRGLAAHPVKARSRPGPGWPTTRATRPDAADRNRDR
ncbi:hypothetical protein ABZ777_09010 [Micromonospora parva]|uniref:hypothetical protein n=1 Tax=Micromonospora parva TaxID=1464048 RepID=UPI0033E6EF7A